MKTKLALLAALILCAGYSQAQTNQTTLDKVIADMGGISATNLAVEAYATYAPKAPTKWGGGALIIYNVNNFVGLGLGLDWLGSFSLVSANVQFSLPYHPLSSYPNFELVPFALLGVATAYSGDGNR